MVDTRERDSNGNFLTNQIGSQFWMNAGYSGEEPSLEVKQAFSSAEYAAGWIGNYANILTKQGTPVSVATEATSKLPMASSPVLQAIWEKYYAISPQAAADARKNQVISPTAQTTAVTPVSAVDYSIYDTAGNVKTGGILNTLGQYGMYIVVGVVIIILAAVVMAKSHI